MSDHDLSDAILRGGPLDGQLHPITLWDGVPAAKALFVTDPQHKRFRGLVRFLRYNATTETDPQGRHIFDYHNAKGY